MKKYYILFSALGICLIAEFFLLPHFFTSLTKNSLNSSIPTYNPLPTVITSISPSVSTGTTYQVQQSSSQPQPTNVPIQTQQFTNTQTSQSTNSNAPTFYTPQEYIPPVAPTSAPIPTANTSCQNAALSNYNGDMQNAENIGTCNAYNCSSDVINQRQQAEAAAESKYQAALEACNQ